jgi:two-component system, sensor histidine kinase YesM
VFYKWGKSMIGMKSRQVTFKKRIFMIFLFSSLIPFVFLGFLSFYTIDSILRNKVEGSLQSELKQDLITLENMLNNLNHVSQQLAYGGNLNNLIEELGNENDPYSRIKIRSEIKNEINLISFSNPNVGLITYYYPDEGKFDFENFRLRSDFVSEDLPMMVKYPEITYYGPHLSYNGLLNQFVFSTMRRVNLPDQEIYLYIETGRNVLEKFLMKKEDNQSRQLLLLDNDGRIAFSENESVFPANSIFPDFHKTKSDFGYQGDFYWNKETSNQGWSIVSIIPSQELNKERDQWLLQVIIIFAVFALLASLIAWLLWKMVYSPLNKFNKEVNSLMQSDAEQTELTRIPEFDHLLLEVRDMKSKIWSLYAEIEKKEKRRADLEVEKLLYQINPHFLMNTLDTVHWMAVFSGQEKIDNLVLSLNKLLSYNLGKMGEATTINQEIQALIEYFQLQQTRYDFQYDIDVDESARELTIPRFILQPLVENALYHGVSDNGYIHIGVKLTDKLIVTIQDNGGGMSEEEIERLLQDQPKKSQKVGMGIGMKYVKRILEASYGEQAKFEIKSEIGKGTIVTLTIPISGGVPSE